MVGALHAPLVAYARRQILAVSETKFYKGSCVPSESLDIPQLFSFPRPGQERASQFQRPKPKCVELPVTPGKEPAGHPQRPQEHETDPTHDKIPLHTFLCNEGLVQKPLEPLQQGQHVSVQPPPPPPPSVSYEKAWKATGGC
eukprot:jgi/Botrbrau1/19156/Bobra.0077s0068.1